MAAAWGVVMVHWARNLIDLPQNAAQPCVLITSISGSANEQRQQRRALALQMAAQCFGEKGLHIGVGSNGALRFFDRWGVFAALFLSHATRGGLSAIAVSREPIGVDLELTEPEFEVPWHVLHPDECARLDQLPLSERHLAFLRMWTAKEASLKLTGEGLLTEPSHLEWRSEYLVHGGTGKKFHLNEFRETGFIACVATQC